MRRVLAYGALLVGLAAGCPFSFTNEDHCAARAGDATCAAASPATPYCALDGCGLYDEVDNRTGCVAEQPTQLSCYSPCGGKQDANANSECGVATDGTTTDPATDTEEPTTTTSDVETGSTTTGGCACDPEAPICIDGECVACPDDLFCKQTFPDAREVCEANDCVTCVPTLGVGRHHRGCEPGLPNCIDEMCAPDCLQPADCSDTGCDHRDGVCGPSDRKIYVDPSGNDDAAGTLDAPLQSIAAAVLRSPVEGTDDYFPTTIYLASGTYSEAIEIEDRTVILRPTNLDGARPALTSQMGQPIFTLPGSTSTLNVVNLRIENSEGPVVNMVSAAHFLADGIEMWDNAIGFEGSGTIFLRNSIVTGTAGRLLQATGDVTFSAVATTIVDNSNATLLLDCSSFDAIVDIRDSIVGNTQDGRTFSETVSPGCQLAGGPRRTVTGADVPEVVFRPDDLRLDINPIPALELTGVEFCEEGTGASAYPPCPPVVDIDGKDRLADGGNWAGASVP